MTDIRRQLRGLPIPEQDRADAAHYIFAELVRVIESLFTFATLSPEEECNRRLQAIAAVNALCSSQEGRGFRRRDRGAADTKPVNEDMPSALSESLPLESRPPQCIFCLGDEGLLAVKRLWRFSSRGDLKKHFHRKHLRHLPDGYPIACPILDAQLPLTAQRICGIMPKWCIERLVEPSPFLVYV